MRPLVLITGSNGQLGSELKSLAKEQGSLDFLFTDIKELDITNKEALINYVEKHKPDFIINCAGYTAVDKAEKEKQSAIRLNSLAVQNIIKAIEQSSCRLIHISTDYVLNGHGDHALNEEDIPGPQSVYALSKYKGELNALKSDKSIIVRTSWLYSSYGHNFVKTILRLSKERDSINVVNDQIGTPTYGADLARAIISIIATCNSNPQINYAGIYHYSNSGKCSWYDFACRIKNIRDLNIDIKPISTEEYPLPAPRPAYSVLNKDKIKRVFSISIPEWEDSLEECLALLDK